MTHTPFKSILVRLNSIMGSLGFHKGLDSFETALDAGIPHGLVYTDLDGNTVELHFGEEGERLPTIARFNAGSRLSWPSVEEACDAMTEAVRNWLNGAPPQAPLSLQQPPVKKTVKAASVLRKLRAGVDQAVLLKEYGLTQKALENILHRLVQEGVLEIDEMVTLRSRVVEVKIKRYICMNCGENQFARLESCPLCGGMMKGVK